MTGLLLIASTFAAFGFGFYVVKKVDAFFETVERENDQKDAKQEDGDCQKTHDSVIGL